MSKYLSALRDGRKLQGGAARWGWPWHHLPSLALLSKGSKESRGLASHTGTLGQGKGLRRHVAHVQEECHPVSGSGGDGAELPHGVGEMRTLPTDHQLPPQRCGEPFNLHPILLRVHLLCHCAEVSRNETQRPSRSSCLWQAVLPLVLDPVRFAVAEPWVPGCPAALAP